MFYLAHPAYHALLHMKHATNSTTKGTPYRVPSGQDPWVLPAKPDIPPMAAPPEASYRRPEDNIVLSHMPRITRDAYTKYICVHHFLIGRGTLDRMPLDVRSMGSARQTGHTPHGRTSATPSPQRMKILTKDLLGRVAHERRGHYCFISLTQNTTRVIYLRLSRPVLPRTR